MGLSVISTILTHWVLILLSVSLEYSLGKTCKQMAYDCLRQVKADNLLAYIIQTPEGFASGRTGTGASLRISAPVYQ